MSSLANNDSSNVLIFAVAIVVIMALGGILMMRNRRAKAILGERGVYQRLTV